MYLKRNAQKHDVVFVCNYGALKHGFRFYNFRNCTVDGILRKQRNIRYISEKLQRATTDKRCLWLFLYHAGKNPVQRLAKRSRFLSLSKELRFGKVNLLSFQIIEDRR